MYFGFGPPRPIGQSNPIFNNPNLQHRAVSEHGGVPQFGGPSADRFEATNNAHPPVFTGHSEMIDRISRMPLEETSRHFRNPEVFAGLQHAAYNPEFTFNV